MPAAVRLASVLGAAAAHAAGDDTTDRAQLHGARRPHGGSDLTLVTLECTPVDIAMSVGGEGRRVYSPRVLRLRGQGAWRQFQAGAMGPLRGGVPGYARPMMVDIDSNAVHALLALPAPATLMLTEDGDQPITSPVWFRATENHIEA